MLVTGVSLKQNIRRSPQNPVQKRQKFAMIDNIEMIIGSLFSWSGDVAQPCPLCVACGEKMANESTVPNKSQRHLTTKHSCLQDKDLNYFKTLLQQQSKQRNVFQKTMTVSERAQLASIEVAEIIAVKSKSLTLAESVILPACKKIVKSMLGETAEKEISKIRFQMIQCTGECKIYHKTLTQMFRKNLKDLYLL